MKCEKYYLDGLDAYELNNGQLKLLFVPELGGRLIGLEYCGAELLYRPEHLGGLKLDLDSPIENIAEYRKALGWRNLGGDKTWIGPQCRWDGPPYLDLDSGKYEFREELKNNLGVVEMTSPICRETEIQVKRKFMVEPKMPELILEQSISNWGDDAVSWSIWNVTQLNGPGEVYLPINPRNPCPSGLKIYEGLPGKKLFMTRASST